MTAEELNAIVESALPDRAAQPGSVLYSGLDTITPGDFYLMGYNPGGDPTNESENKSIGKTVAENLSNPRIHYSAYTMECWRKHKGACDHIGDKRLIGAGVKHQENVGTLCAALHGVQGREPSLTATERTPSANAIFARSRKSGGVDESQWWSDCWKVHQKLLAVVRPRWIVSLGRGWKHSAFALLRQQAKVSDAEVRYTSEADGRTDGRFFKAEFELEDSRADVLTVGVLGIPHPSWYSMSPALTVWIGNFVSQGVVDDALSGQS